MGGDVRKMQEINAEYDAAFKRLSDNDTSESADDYKSVIDGLLKIDDITVELCGSWLWISGNTKEHKDEIKACGCRWAKSKKMWYWKPAGQFRRTRRTYSMNEIRSMHGSKVLSKEEKKNRLSA